MSTELNEQLGTSTVVWDLDDLYLTASDELIVDDIGFCEQEAVQLNKEFSGRLAELKSEDFVSVVKRLERIAQSLGRMSTFAFLNFSTQIENEEAGAFLQQIREAASRIDRECIFVSA